MAPIRIGMIGLSTNAKTSWAAVAHLPYLRESGGKYTIAALCNSSVASAMAAVEAFKLPTNTKVYGNPEDLASDNEIDLVVCCTRVDIHYETIKPSLLRGKNVYCEWPLSANFEQAAELQAIAKEKGLRTVVGLQAKASPPISKVQTLISQGRIGNILSSTIVASGGSQKRDTLIQGLKYFTEKRVGGNIVTIGFGHMIDYVLSTLGELSSFRTQLSIQRPRVDIVGSDGEVAETVTSDVPDHIMLQGKLTSGAPLSVTFRRGEPFKGEPGLIWYINGEKGEIKVTSAGTSLQVRDDNVVIVLDDFAKDGQEVVSWERKSKELSAPARNIAAMYEAFAAGDAAKYPSFDHAILRHKLIAEVFRSSDEDVEGVYI